MQFINNTSMPSSSLPPQHRIPVNIPQQQQSNVHPPQPMSKMSQQQQQRQAMFEASSRLAVAAQQIPASKANLINQHHGQSAQFMDCLLYTSPSPRD